MIYDIPINFCPKCNNKKIIVVMGKQYENEYSLTGKCIKKSKNSYTTYTLLKCNKCGWISKTWNEAGYEDGKEYEELQELYLKRSRENVSRMV